VLSLLQQLERSERWSADEIRTVQFRQVARLLVHAQATVPYYQRILSDWSATDLAAMTPEKWADLPVLGRADIQSAGAQLHSTSVPGSHGKVSEIFTSGTTGRPVRVLRTELCNLLWAATTIRDHVWHGRDLSGKLAVIRNSEKGADPFPDGTATRSWGVSNLVFDTGPGVSLNINTTPEQQADWLQRQAPDYLLTHPTNVLRVANHCREHGMALPNLRQVLTISEILRPEVRDACRAAWDAGVADMYTTRDIGYLALQCPEGEGYHVQSEGVLLEILDGEGRPCPPGGTGRVVVTALHNFAMPLIRYEIGDYAEAGGSCSCGRGLPVLRRILGREQDMVTLPGGETRWTLLSSGNIASFLAIAPIRQYQFVQRNAESIEVRLVVERPLTEDETNELRRWIVAKLDHPFDVDFSFVDAIAREPSGKYRDFVSEM